MTNYALRHVFICILYITLLGNATSYAQNEPIIYKLFPSLEEYILSPEGSHRRDICGFAIQYNFDSASHKKIGYENDSTFALYIFSHTPVSVENLLKNSNRYIQINNNYYPVFIMQYDDSFGDKKSTKNNNYKEKYYFIYTTPYRIQVNMANKTFYKL